MKITEALKSLDKAWSREEILIKIKHGTNSEKIVNDFFNKEQEEIQTLANFIKPKDRAILSEIEKLYYIESKLINKIKNHSLDNMQLSQLKKDQDPNMQFYKTLFSNFSLFMMKWSNKFVFISLLVISAFALTKQAWA